MGPPDSSHYTTQGMPEGCRTDVIAESTSSVNIIGLPPSTNNPTKTIGVQSDVERSVNTDAHINMPHLSKPATTRINSHPTIGHLNQPQPSAWPSQAFATPPPQATASNITQAWAALESARKFITAEEYSVLSAHLASPQTRLASNETPTMTRPPTYTASPAPSSLSKSTSQPPKTPLKLPSPKATKEGEKKEGPASKKPQKLTQNRPQTRRLAPSSGHRTSPITARHRQYRHPTRQPSQSFVKSSALTPL